MITNSIFERGEVLDVVIPNTPHPEKAVQKLRNVIKSQHIKRVIVLSPSTDNTYYCVACKSKQTKKGIPIVIGANHHCYAHVYPLLIIDADVLSRASDSELNNKRQVLLEIEYMQQEYGSQKAKTVNQPTPAPSSTIAASENKHDLTLLSHEIRLNPNNVVCPNCRKLIPTGTRQVYIPGYGFPSIRVGLCKDCQKYFSFHHKLREQNGELSGMPVYWSNLRYKSGFGDSIQFKTTAYTKDQIDSKLPPPVPHDRRRTNSAEIIPANYPVMMKQLPISGVHNTKCPICKKACNSTARIEYAQYDNQSIATTRFTSARNCLACNIVFLDRGQESEVRFYAKEQHVSFFDANNCKTPDELLSIAVTAPPPPSSAHASTAFPYEFDDDVFPNLSQESTIISIYAKKCHCHDCLKKYGRDPIKNRTAIVSTISGESIKVNVMFCRGCGKYYMNLTSFEEYRKRFGGLLSEFRYTEELTRKKKSNLSFDQDSILSRCGYSVAEGISKEYRHAILRYILDSGKASKWEIITLLSGFIELREGRASLRPACFRWREDIFFVNHYEINSQEKVYGLSFKQMK